MPEYRNDLKLIYFKAVYCGMNRDVCWNLIGQDKTNSGQAYMKLKVPGSNPPSTSRVGVEVIPYGASRSYKSDYGARYFQLKFNSQPK